RLSAGRRPPAERHPSVEGHPPAGRWTGVGTPYTKSPDIRDPSTRARATEPEPSGAFAPGRLCFFAPEGRRPFGIQAALTGAGKEKTMNENEQARTGAQDSMEALFDNWHADDAPEEGAPGAQDTPSDGVEALFDNWHADDMPEEGEPGA